MLCEKPFGIYPCGSCLPCLTNRRRLWSVRIVLESYLHVQSAFATLTYAPESCPVELKPSHVQLFLKRLRRRYEPARLRYFAVGEYGDRTFRPHYHLALFGVHVADGHIVSDAWGRGFVQLGELNEKSAMYVAGYVCKKMTSAEDPRLLGRHPEFARMSLRPHGIGHGAGPLIAQALTSEGGSNGLMQSGDVPSEVRIDGKKMPLGRYLRGGLRESVGWSGETPKEVVRLRALVKSLESMEDVRELEAKRSGAAASARARFSIYKSGRKL